MTITQRTTCLIGLACLCAGSGALAAQTPVSRSEIRPAPSILFSVGEISGPSRVLLPEPASALPDSVHSNGALRGAIVGGGALGLLGGMIAFGMCESGRDGSCIGRGLLGVLPGAVVGATIGGILGSM